MDIVTSLIDGNNEIMLCVAAKFMYVTLRNLLSASMWGNSPVDLQFSKTSLNVTIFVRIRLYEIKEPLYSCLSPA